MIRQHLHAVRTMLLPVRQQEDLARQAFAQARREVETVQSNIRRLHEAMGVQNDRARRTLVDGHSAIGLAPYRHCVAEIRACLEQERQRLVAANEAFFCCRQELIEAMKQRKALCTLQDRLAVLRSSDIERAANRETDRMHTVWHAGRSDEPAVATAEALP